ncbi:MAG: epoxyqueuosine reductase QueH [Anaerolineae bacterium]
MSRLLLHLCCGPCATYPVPHLRGLGYDVTGLWFNPNIQPEAEHAQRQASALQYAELAGLPLIVLPYETERFLAAIAGHEDRPERCRRCYRLRLEETAQVAQREGFDIFSTTLLISPYQDLLALRDIGQEAAEKHGVQYYGHSMRRGYSQRGPLARQYGLYLQQYCGCAYSQAERQAQRLQRHGPHPAERVADTLLERGSASRGACGPDTAGEQDCRR